MISFGNEFLTVSNNQVLRCWQKVDNDQDVVISSAKEFQNPNTWTVKARLNTNS